MLFREERAIFTVGQGSFAIRSNGDEARYARE